MEKVFEVVIGDMRGGFETGIVVLEDTPEMNQFLRMVLCIDETGVSYFSSGFLTEFKEIEPSKLFEETQIKQKHIGAA